MPKIKNNIIRDAVALSPHYLDTLETTSDCSRTKTHASQYSKAMRKHATNQKLKSIIDTISDKLIKKKYWNTYHCNRVLLQDGFTFKGSLCRKRWCAHCCRIKTAEMTNGYKQPLQELGPLYFVTLTRPNVKARQLSDEIKKMTKGFQRIKDNLRKNYGIKLNGIRKIEVTYNEIEDTFHPHFHFIQSNYNASIKLQELWLAQFSNAKLIAQDVRPINTHNDDSFIELFKYATKETTKSGKQYTGKVLHTIYNALEGKRIYQAYGKLKKVKEPLEAKSDASQITWIEPNEDIWVYDDNLSDWIDGDGQELVMTHSFTEQQKTLNLNQYENTSQRQSRRISQRITS